MDQRMRETWRKLEAFDIDDLGDGSPPPTFNFARRLAAENGWSLDYSKRVIEEYKRFVLLACFAGHPVTPSDEVDQAWHLHLTYSRSYWNRLCDQVLERRLHHDPTRGGEAESEKFDTWYARTLESYQRIFGALPASDVWPEPRVRFDTARTWRRVDVSRFWMLRRRPWPRRAFGATAAAATLAVAGGWAAPMVAMTDQEMVIVAILAGVILLSGAALIIRRRRNCGSNSGSSTASGTTTGGFMGCGGGDHRSSHHDHSDHGGDSSSDSGGGAGNSGCSNSGCGGGGCGGGGD